MGLLRDAYGQSNALVFIALIGNILLPSIGFPLTGVKKDSPNHLLTSFEVFTCNVGVKDLAEVPIPIA